MEVFSQTDVGSNFTDSTQNFRMEEEMYIQTYWIVILIVLVILFLILIVVQYLSKKNYKAKADDYKTQINEQTLIYGKKEAELKVSYQTWAIEQFDKFKKTELEKIEEIYKINAIKMANVKLQEWKIKSEAEIRKDAINRSYAVNLGKITEHLVPFHQVFLSRFNPKDARFIGSPIDLIVFDGYADKKDDLSIYFVEIKTGNSKLTDIQKKVKSAVVEGRVRWAEINPDNEDKIIDIRTSEYDDAINNNLVEISNELQPNLFSLNNYDEILNIFSKHIKEGNSQNQSLKLTCQELGLNLSNEEWETFKKTFLRRYNSLTK
jgi:predicted Holliday junction resolvase-like endonuclease